MKRTIYDNGLPFISTKNRLERLIESCQERIGNNLPSAIIIDGSSGTGKTTLAVHLAERYEGRKIVIDEQLANGVEDFKEKLLICGEIGHRVLIFDEAGEANRKSTMNAVNRAITRVFELYRAYNVFVIICLPRFYFLESDILQLGIVRGLIHVHRRSTKYSDFKIFRIKQMMMIKHWVKKLADPMDCYKYGIPQSRGHFLDLPVERSLELSKFSLDAKNEELKKTIYGVKDRVTLDYLMRHFKKSKPWVLKQLREIGNLGEVRTFQRRKYYEKSIIKRIAELED